MFTNKNVSDGVDKRSYKGNFNKIQSFPKFKTKWFVNNGIEDLLKNTKLNVNKRILSDKKFHRLKYYEFLRKKGKLLF